MKVGFIGLGKMGSRMSEKLLREEHEVLVWNRSKDVLEEFKSLNPQAVVASSIEELINGLEGPRVIWIMVSHQAVDEILTEVKKFVDRGDVVVDGGNSNYKDTQRRSEEFENLGVHFLGIGTSGGIKAIDNGFPFMVGGSREGYDLIAPILDTLSKPNGGHEYFGTGGAGHFVKMVHNGIEYAMMQAIGEGFEVLEKSKYELDLAKVASLWKKGTIVSGFLIDRASEMLNQEKDLSSFGGVVSRSGEGDWTVEAAKEEGVEVELIASSVEYRKRSETDNKIQNSFTAKMINALRKAFGGHEVKS